MLISSKFPQPPAVASLLLTDGSRIIVHLAYGIIPVMPLMLRPPLHAQTPMPTPDSLQSRYQIKLDWSLSRTFFAKVRGDKRIFVWQGVMLLLWNYHRGCD